MNKEQINNLHGYGGQTYNDTDKNYSLCEICIHCKLCFENNILGKCNGMHFNSNKNNLTYKDVLTFLPTPYPKCLQGSNNFVKGYNTALQTFRSTLFSYFKEVN